MDTFFALLCFFAVILAIVSLITPKTAFFLKEKTRVKAFFSWLGIAVITLAVFAALMPKKEDAIKASATAPAPAAAQTTPQAQAMPQEELRALYLELEGWLRTGKLMEKGWTLSKENQAWHSRVTALLKITRSDANISAAVRDAAEALSPLHTGLSTSGQFSEVSEKNLKVVLAGIRTGSDDTIGNDMLKLAVEHRAAEPSAEEQAKAESERRSLMARHTADEQKTLSSFLKELDTLRNNKRFWELGFAVTNQQAADWKRRVENWRTRIEKDETIALEVRITPATLLMLGLEWQRNKGNMTDAAQSYYGDLRTGLDWKPSK